MNCCTHVAWIQLKSPEFAMVSLILTMPVPESIAPSGNESVGGQMYLTQTEWPFYRPLCTNDSQIIVTKTEQVIKFDKIKSTGSGLLKW